MIRLAAILMLAPLAGGCVAAAAIPALAGSAIVKTQLDRKRAQRAEETRQSAPAQTVETPEGRLTILKGMTALPPPSGNPAAGPAAAPATGGAVPETMQYLYGSGESAGLSIQAYRALAEYLTNNIAYRRKETLRQVVMSDGSSLNAPLFEPCGQKPLAVVLDIDETAVLNLGYEGDAARRGGGYDDARWQRWEASGADKVVAVPGAKTALDAARKAGIAVIFNSNRSNANAAATEAALNHAGLGPAKHGETLWLKGDDGGGSGKDDRRWAIASGYCVVAMVGDQLGDFSDLFNDPRLAPAVRRTFTTASPVAELWGNGWFLLPNPVYGTGLKGGFDDVFPTDTRWSDPAEGVK
ncbi:HAD family acid phosphatase [Sphingomonas sp. DT-204]|uniref:HAD family acid phosphatase n=1 Tax=Sphingomonas sp. DT-204 TaxID=3396166 RepID=UPI003F1A7928